LPTYVDTFGVFERNSPLVRIRIGQNSGNFQAFRAEQSRKLSGKGIKNRHYQKTTLF